MAIKVGTTTASLYLGSTPVAAYLGTEQVYSAVQAVTLYFSDAEEDGLWTTVGNWWLDAGHNEPAGRLPAEIDSVVATVNITASGQAVVNFTLNGQDEENGSALLGSLTVTGMAMFSGFGALIGTVTGNATFNDIASNEGTVTGNATFNDSSANNGTVGGTVTCNTTGNCTPA
jgi:flagellar hook assembly protein FlgD